MKCTACGGTGYYDHDGSPPCGACNGNGFIEVPDQFEAAYDTLKQRLERAEGVIGEVKERLKHISGEHNGDCVVCKDMSASQDDVMLHDVVMAEEALALIAAYEKGKEC